MLAINIIDDININRISFNIKTPYKNETPEDNVHNVYDIKLAVSSLSSDKSFIVGQYAMILMTAVAP